MDEKAPVSQRPELSLCALFQQPDLTLQVCEEAPRVGAVHLRVMELEGDGELIPQECFAVSSPKHKGVVEDTAVHADYPVDLRVHDGGGADDHAVFRRGLCPQPCGQPLPYG